MQIGRRVEIIDPKHPHYGERGKVKGRYIPALSMAFDWIIRLKDKPIDCAVKNEQIKQIDT